MKISGSAGPHAPVNTAVSESVPADNNAPVAVAKADAVLQSASLQQAQAALDALPQIDEAKVATLREALAKGELPFDAGKLAGLIDRYHGSRS
jgi:negative regulator of flagellin synthesis FlgM